MFPIRILVLVIVSLVTPIFGRPYGVGQQSILTTVKADWRGKQAVQISSTSLVREEDANRMDTLKAPSVVLDFTPTNKPTSISSITSLPPLFTLDSFARINLPLAISKHIIDEHDVTCSHASNALLTTASSNSRSYPPSYPRILYTPSSSSTSMSKKTYPSFFHLHSITVKPVGYTPSNLMLSIHGYKIIDSHVVNVYQGRVKYLTAGHQDALELDVLGEGWMGEINALEIWAASEEGERWMVCVGEIKVGSIE